MVYLALPGLTELWPILVVLLLLFGAKKLPELARAMGSSINMFKKGLSEEDANQELEGGEAAKSAKLSEGEEQSASAEAASAEAAAVEPKKKEPASK